MRIDNTTHICIELIKAIAMDVGLDLSEHAVLEIEYSTGIKQGLKDNTLGGFFSYVHGGVKHYVVQIAAIAGTDTLAHELRHAYQCQVMGDDLLIQVNHDELKAVGYLDNALEVDAREFALRWTF